MIQLVKKAQKRDERAFLKLFKKYEEDIYRMAFVYVKNENDALDVVQEVAYRAFNKIDTLKNPEYLKTWLMKITITCSINITQKNKKMVYLKPEYHEQIGIEDEDVPLSITLQEFLDKLTDLERSIVMLKYYEEYTFKEISELVNLPLGTVKSVLYRTIHKLRKEFKEADFHE
ncbi:sigma-70 family RNA polymerase sigma factor [Bacillus spongiae]|uniref:Sigma-70 family RNA polymerase sigma factor n=1 Tax=Bacillus spongiae TaxID=2683610 RepID=A0ABU8HD61_9BACI